MTGDNTSNTIHTPFRQGHTRVSQNTNLVANDVYELRDVLVRRDVVGDDGITQGKNNQLYLKLTEQADTE